MEICKLLTKELENVYETLGYDKQYAIVSFSNRPEICDFQNNGAFAVAKKVGKTPFEIAKTIAENLNLEGYNVEAVAPAFVNITVCKNKLSEIANLMLNAKNLGLQEHQKKKKVLFDYGGANVAKSLHVGHLRSPLIGESLKRIYRLFGHTVWSDSHLGDWGLQMGLTIAQLEEDGILDYYFLKKGTKPEITLDMLNVAYPKASLRKNSDIPFKKKADDFTLFVQQKKEPYFTIYQQIRTASVKKIKELYANLNAYFDLWYGESTADPYIAEAIEIFNKKGLTRISNDALVVDVAREGEQIPIPKKNPDDEQLYKNPMPPTILKKYNGGDMYATTDIATILMRNREQNPDEIIYLTDNRQGLHFEQVFRCVKLADISPEEQILVHIPFGTMNGTDGKPFKTRAGDVVRLDDVSNILTAKAQEKLTQNGLGDNPKLALQIGIAAMKFGDLSNVVNKDYVFDIDRFASFEGKTGPYLQYTAARIKSILSKSKESDFCINIKTDEERKIVLEIQKLLASFQICFNDRSLNALCLSVYNVASAFSTFYNNIHILSESDDQRKNSLLGICKLTLLALELALNTLAIDIPEKM